MVSERTQWLSLLAACAAVLLAVGIGDRYNPALFQPYLGSLPPLAVFVSACASTLLLLKILKARGYFTILRHVDLHAILAWQSLALAFGAAAIAVDCFAPFPAAMNVSFPLSLAFYPAIGLLVELAFHIAPLSILHRWLPSASGRANERPVRISIAAVALLEPAFQILASSAAGQLPGRDAWVFVHVYLINLCQLVIFRRQGFLPMYLFRITYYLVWHIVWGHFRLQLLF